MLVPFSPRPAAEVEAGADRAWSYQASLVPGSAIRAVAKARSPCLRVASTSQASAARAEEQELATAMDPGAA